MAIKITGDFQAARPQRSQQTYHSKSYGSRKCDQYILTVRARALLAWKGSRQCEHHTVPCSLPFPDSDGPVTFPDGATALLPAVGMSA